MTVKRGSSECFWGGSARGARGLKSGDRTQLAGVCATVWAVGA